jgi:CheY-like chemotaxis protein
MDVLVSDINMNEESGYSPIRAVRALESEDVRLIPAIALTAEARFSDRMSALAAGFHLHVPKPVEPAEVDHADR